MQGRDHEPAGTQLIHARRRQAAYGLLPVCGPHWTTASGRELSTRELDRFNRSLVAQIEPHWEKLELQDVLLKFTGDGWLLVTHDDQKAESLCCLATIMAHKFHEEMARSCQLSLERIPGLRLAIGSGRDLRVVLPNGQVDYVGDSVRRAVRALGWYDRTVEPAEILVCETIRQLVDRDFVVGPKDVTRTRHKPKKAEEVFPLYVLGELRPEAMADVEAPASFAYTLGVLGKSRETVAILEAATESVRPNATPAARREFLWNKLVSGAPDYITARGTFRDMIKGGLCPQRLRL